MKKSRIVIFCFSLILLSSCSIRTDLFIYNFTSENIVLKIIYNYPIEIDEYKKNTLHYENGIVNPKYFLKNETLKSLEVIEFSEYNISLKIPNNSTSRIEVTSNYRYLHNINSIEINSKKYTIQEFEELAIKQKSNHIFKIEK